LTGLAIAALWVCEIIVTRPIENISIKQPIRCISPKEILSAKFWRKSVLKINLIGIAKNPAINNKITSPLTEFESIAFVCAYNLRMLISLRSTSTNDNHFPFLFIFLILLFNQYFQLLPQIIGLIGNCFIISKLI